MAKENINKTITRNCSICSAELQVTLHPDKSYEGGHYFGAGAGAEYWECDKCYNDKK